MDNPAEEFKAPSMEDMTENERANLAQFMSPEALKVIGGKVRERYDRDLSSRAAYMQQRARLQKLYALIAEKKTIPWANCANVKTPSLTGPVLQIQARLYDMVLPPTGKIFNVIPATVQDQQSSNVAEQFANSYVRYKMPEMPQGMASVLHGKCLYGSGFRRTAWDAYEGRVRSDTVPIDDFVVAYSMRSKDPSLTDVPRYTMVHHLTGYELRQRGDAGLFVNVDKIKFGEVADGEKTEFRRVAERIDGHSPEEEPDDDYSTRQVLEQHCTMRLPNTPKVHPSFDGKEHFVYALVDATSRTVLRLSLREENDPDDARRYQRQQEKFEQYLQQQAAYEAAQAAPVQDMTAPPEMGAQDTTLPPEMAPMPPEMASADAGLGAAMAPPPMVPKPTPAPAPGPIRKRQIPFFTHYRCFESDGFYGLGYGDLLYGLCMAQNTVINQWIDGMALKNAKPAFMSRQSRMARGQINIGPGQVTEVDVPAGSIKDALVFIDPPQADPGTVPLIRMLDSMRDVIAGNADLMSGQAPGSNQTKAGMEILNEQMMAPITVLARQTKDEFRHELDKIWRCWGVFLEDDFIADVVSEAGQPQQIPVGKAMFTPSVHLVPASDPRMKSQRLEDLKGLTGFVAQNPVIAQNPQIAMPLMLKLAEMVMSTYPDGAALIPLLHPPPPPPPQPMSQLEENVGFLRGQDHPVHPADNDDEHIAHIHAFMGSEDAHAMDEKGRMMLINHHRQHIAQRLQKRGAAVGQARPIGPFPGGPPGMAPQPGVGGPPGPPPA